jgi:hypothetical protein
VQRAEWGLRPGAKGSWVAGCGELPGWIGLAIGAFVTAFAGRVVGIFVGAAVGVLAFGVVMGHAIRYEAQAGIYSCEQCGRSLQREEWKRGERNDG